MFADFDNDGDLDLFNGHTWSGHHRLYRNEGGARFVDISDSAGIDVRDLGPRGVAAADLDGNGFLDIIVTGWQGFIPNVYMNRGGMRFERERLSGDPSPEFANQGLSVVDLTGDRRPDIALSSFEFVEGSGAGPIAILANEWPRFTERTGFSGLEYEQTTSDFRGTNGYSFQDIDGDRDLDVVVTGFHGSKLYRNNGENRFNLVRRFDGQHYTAAFGDVDNDGDLDLYLAGDPGLFLNDGEGGFTRLDGVGLDGIGADARSAVFADMDNDGDQDLLIASKQGINTFFRNQSASTGDWLGVSLTAPNGERGAVGASVAVTRAGETNRLHGRSVVHGLLQPGPVAAPLRPRRGGRTGRRARAVPERGGGHAHRGHAAAGDSDWRRRAGRRQSVEQSSRVFGPRSRRSRTTPARASRSEAPCRARPSASTAGTGCRSCARVSGARRGARAPAGCSSRPGMRPTPTASCRCGSDSTWRNRCGRWSPVRSR